MTAFALANAVLVSSAYADGPAITVPLSGTSSTTSSFTSTQLEYVVGWNREKAPECPHDTALAAAQRFLEELQSRQPARLEALIAGERSTSDLDSTLLRHVGSQLTGAAQSTLREEIARRRVAAFLSTPAAASVGSRDASALVGKIKEASSVQYRRLLEGRVEDDDLALLLKKNQQPAAAAAPAAAPAKPKTLTAAEIVSEFARRNQSGSALQHLRAYTIEARLTAGQAPEQTLFLFKMRPDRFRLLAQTAGVTNYIMGYDGQSYWQQVPGQNPQVVKRELVGSRRYLAEFADPLFGEEKTEFQRLEDGAEDGQKFYRLSVQRADGSRYVVRIDPATFRQVGRENEDGSLVRYSDFREVGGITVAFREDLSDRNGGKGVVTLARMTPNPGLIEAYFDPAPPGRPDFFEVERIRAAAPVAAK